MSNQVFAFKQFTLKQDKCAMKVGTDAVLLGAWANTEQATSILDIGTGTGIIALMLAQKSKASIDAIDIDQNAFIQAQENISISNWADRIKAYHISLQHFMLTANKKYDLIISNPPYFADCSKALDQERTTARHTDLLTFEELLDGVLELLENHGKFNVILPCKEGILFRDMAETKKLFLSKLTRIRTKADKTTEKRFLMEFEFQRNTFSENTITIEQDSRHHYTNEYKELTKDYYLAF